MMNEEVEFSMKLKTALIIVGIALFYLALCWIDRGLKQPITNATAPVIHKTFVGGECSHYGLVLFFDDQPQLFRVPEPLFYEVKRGDHLYITKWRGLISGYTYQTTLYANKEVH